MKFDIVIGNPPYKRGLHLKFLDFMIRVSTQAICIHPSGWLLNKTYGRRRTLAEDIADNYLKKYNTSFSWVNGNQAFDASFFSPLVITNVQKDAESIGAYELLDLNGDIQTFNNFDEINMVSDSREYLRLREKIINYSKTNTNLSNTESYNNPSDELPYGVRVSKIRGSLCKVGFFKDDFYTLIPRKVKVLEVQDFNQSANKNIKDYSYWFSTKEEAENFIDYLKLDVVRFALSIYKVACDLRPHHKIIPFIDYTKKWSEDDVMNLLGITEEEREWINRVIPKYYILSA